MTKPCVVVQFSSMPPSSRYGGAERVVGAFADELEQAGFRVHNCGLKSRSAEPAEPGYPINNIYWPFDGPRRGVARRTLWHAVDTFTLSSRRTVQRIVDELRPDVVITHNLRGWGYAPWVVAGERGLPLVHVVHDYSLVCKASTLWHGGVSTDICPGCRPRVTMTQRRWPGGQVVGASRAVLSEHVSRLGLKDFDNSIVIHPTAVAHDLQAATRPLSTGIPKTIGYLGRLTEHKGVELLVAAIGGSAKKLILAGEGEPEYVERLLAGAGGNVEWRGWTDDHKSFFDAIDVLVVPSLWLDPFPLVVLDGARAGVPVLVADRPGLVEAALFHGARHATFPAGDVEALRQALDRPLSNYQIFPTTIEQADIIDLTTRLASERKTG